MPLLEQLEQRHQEAMANIRSYFRPSDCDMISLAVWLCNTDANPYDFLPRVWAGLAETSTGMSSLLDVIRHALFDDGVITFVSVDGQPKIVFAEKDDAVEKASWDTNYTAKCVEILNIHHNDFGLLYDEWHRKHIRRCFLADVRALGKEKAADQYRKYRLWDESWSQELVSEPFLHVS